MRNGKDSPAVRVVQDLDRRHDAIRAGGCCLLSGMGGEIGVITTRSGMRLRLAGIEGRQAFQI